MKYHYKYMNSIICVVIILICALGILQLFSASTKNDPAGIVDHSLLGLPADNFCLAGIHIDDTMSRDAYTQLSDFFSHPAADLFAFVRVQETELWEDKYDSLYIGSVWKQTASVYVLAELWRCGEAVPETFSLTQYLYGDYCRDEKTNLLREGGVYLLPLVYWSQGDTWLVKGDLDVQFEIDDKGCVWTHSQFAGFRRFDGQDVSMLTEAITTLTSDENISVAVTSFGYIARHGGVLAEATVLSAIPVSELLGGNYIDYFQYILHAEAILSTPAGLLPWRRQWLPVDDVINAISYYAADYLEQGERYLILLDPSENGPFINPNVVAKINVDGTITAIDIPDWTNVFAEYNGLTVEQVKEAAERANAWHKAHVKKFDDILRR